MMRAIVPRVRLVPIPNPFASPLPKGASSTRTVVSPDVIIIGTGVIGAAAAMHLARRGAKVVALDRFGIANAYGSSHGRTRIVRTAYFEHPDYVPLLRASYDGWRELERIVDRSLLHLSGIIYAGPADGAVIGGSRRAAIEHGIDHEMLDHDALRRRYPMLHPPDDHIGLFEPEAGYVECERAVAAMVEVALRHGAIFKTHARVRSIEIGGPTDEIGVHGDHGSLTAPRVIVAAGAWMSELLPRLGWPLTVTRQIVAWLWPRKPELFRFDPRDIGAFQRVLPCWGVEWPPNALHYGFPMAIDGSTGLGLKLALHQAAVQTDPDRVDRSITADDLAGLRAFVRRFIPDADGPVVDARVCLYTNTPDGHFAIGRHPLHDGVIAASACSGHGFKFAPVLGRALADLALDGTTSLPIAFLDPARFA